VEIEFLLLCCVYDLSAPSLSLSLFVHARSLSLCYSFLLPISFSLYVSMYLSSFSPLSKVDQHTSDLRHLLRHVLQKYTGTWFMFMEDDCNICPMALSSLITTVKSVCKCFFFVTRIVPYRRVVLSVSRTHTLSFTLSHRFGWV